MLPTLSMFSTFPVLPTWPHTALAAHTSHAVQAFHVVHIAQRSACAITHHVNISGVDVTSVYFRPCVCYSESYFHWVVASSEVQDDCWWKVEKTGLVQPGEG